MKGFAVIDTNLIDVPTWDKAGWLGAAMMVFTDGDRPPGLGLLFRHGEVGKKIFTDLRAIVGQVDESEELRIAIIETVKGATEPGYYLHVSSNPEKTMARLALNSTPGETKMFLASRIHKMTPAPDSPNLANFKKAYAVHKKYLFMPVTVIDRDNVDPHFDLAIGKQEIIFRHTSDVNRYDRRDRDIVIFGNS